MSIFQLVRLPNLLIVVLIQYLLFYQVLMPAFRAEQLVPVLGSSQIALLILCTILLAAAGYVINDLYDVHSDRINRPHKVIIDVSISRQSGYWLYFCCNLTGFLLALYLAFYVQHLPLLVLFPLAALGLYTYSVWLKQLPLVGNLIVALFCTGVGGIIWFAERETFQDLTAINPLLANKAAYIFVYYLTFAFISTLFRELIKDLEDIAGDRASQYQTAPIFWGRKVAKQIALITGLSLLVLLVLGTVYLHQYFPGLGIYLVALLLVLPIAWALYGLWRAERVRDYRRLSWLTKIIMLGGILLLLLINV